MYLINLVINTGSIPLAWKRAIVTPVFKSGDPRTPGHYRPISTLSLMSKLLEKTIHIQLSEYLEIHNLLNPNQYGFRKGMSTHKAINTLLSQIYTNINHRKYSKLCYIDLKKAFDTVSHDILYGKLESVGVHGRELKLFKNYLCERSQHMKVNGLLSNEGWVRCGVPQGSTLGPLLFLIYVNDISWYLDCSCIMFADDTVLLTQGIHWKRQQCASKKTWIY